MHYKEKMLEDFQMIGMKHGVYPCCVGDCQVMSNSMYQRLCHIGVDHGVFDQYMTEGFLDNIIDHPLPANNRQTPNYTTCEGSWKE